MTKSRICKAIPHCITRLLVCIVAFVLIQASTTQGMEFKKASGEYQSIRIEFYDTLSGLRMSAVYGSNYDKSHRKGEGELSVMGPGDRSEKALVHLIPSEVKELHREIGKLVSDFTLDDDSDQTAFDKRTELAQPYGFHISVFAQESGLTMRYSHLDSKRFRLAGTLFLRFLAKFPPMWRDKVTWKV